VGRGPPARNDRPNFGACRVGLQRLHPEGLARSARCWQLGEATWDADNDVRLWGSLRMRAPHPRLQPPGTRRGERALGAPAVAGVAQLPNQHGREAGGVLPDHARYLHAVGRALEALATRSDRVLASQMPNIALAGTPGRHGRRAGGDVAVALRLLVSDSLVANSPAGGICPGAFPCVSRS
jgi:hypothetical protein